LRAEGGYTLLRIGKLNGKGGRGRTATILFSLATSCKALKIDPFGYLRDVLARVRTPPSRRAPELPPDPKA
jgi:transposase